MNEREVSTAVKDWALATLDDLETGYDYPVATKDGALPDAVVVVNEKNIDSQHPDFPYGELEQVWMRTFSIEMSVMVQVEDDGADDAHHQLQGFGADIENSINADATLGGRVEMVSQRLRFDYSTPFVEYQDGTRGRCLFVYLTVGELIPAPG